MILKKTPVYILFSVLITLGVSCKDAKKTTEEYTQMEQVMAIHDEVMPKMGALGKLANTLEDKINENTNADYVKARKDLKDARSSMMQWMQGFGERFDGDEIMDGKELTEEKQQWLNEEEEKIKALRDQINSSIETAEKLLGEQ